ncbi:oligopeptide ABC transporter [Cutibacterium acnes JCM 18909]|nr:oligopeptide ABC transporter [Cutibacterium acnes JCM 18909]
MISQSGFTSTTHMFAELKSSFFSNVGINLEIREVPDSVAESQACKPNDTNCTWDLSFFGSQSSWYYPVYASGERLFQSGGPVNLGSYSDKKADELIDASMRSNDRAALKTYNDYLAEDLPVLWMPNSVNRVSAWKSNIQGIDPQDPMLYLYPQDWTIT